MHTFSQNGRAQSLLQHHYALLRGFSVIALLVFGGSLNAQAPTATLSPAPQNDGDEADIQIEWGTETETINNVYSFSATFVAEGFKMSAASNFDFDATNSWLFDQNFDFSYSISSDGTQITIEAWRNDQVGQSGYGLVGKGGNVICDIDGDMSKKEASLTLRLLKFSSMTKEAPALLVGPNPSIGFFTLEHPAQKNLGSIKLVDLRGSIVKTWNVQQPNARLETGDIPNGLYFVISQENGVLRKQKILIQR